jgi:hypothetical protein
VPAWLLGVSVVGLLAGEFRPEDAEGFWGGLALIADI